MESYSAQQRSTEHAGNPHSSQILPPELLLEELLRLRTDIAIEAKQTMERWHGRIEERSFRISACNLAAYLALRRRDLRHIQISLPPLGLSSLGRGEARVVENLDAVIMALQALLGGQQQIRRSNATSRFYRGQRLLERNARRVLGVSPSHRRVRIMVTLPTEAAGNVTLLTELLKRGMNIARINCAHDNHAIWSAMIHALREAEEITERHATVLMDLGGPKARTGAVLLPVGTERITSGEALLLTRAVPDAAYSAAFQVQCLIPEALDQLKPGQRVWIDDGKLGTVVEEITAEGALLRVTQARSKGERIRTGKGLNFPDTDLKISPLTDKDLEDLQFAVNYADAVGYSFVQRGSDIALLQTEINRCQQSIAPEMRHSLAIIAKIETLNAVRNLPDIIVQAAGHHAFGVMIARGDLAVEIGFERIAEIQEELLWLCEAAHIPVIWATQVLESYVKNRLATRAEITDAAMAERAECVMLNKGDYITEAVTLLDTILTRMQDHQLKKTSHLRALRAFLYP